MAPKRHLLDQCDNSPDGRQEPVKPELSYKSYGGAAVYGKQVTAGIPMPSKFTYTLRLPLSFRSPLVGTNKIPVILGRYPLLGFFCRLNIVPLDRDNGTFNSSNTDVVETVNFFGGCFTTRGYFGGGRIPIARGQKWLCFGHFSGRGGPFLWVFSKTKF